MSDKCRADVWLWRARFFKTRSLAAAAVSSGAVRLSRNGLSRSLAKPAEAIQIGDGLAISVAKGKIRSVAVLAFGERRGPASEARLLYQDLDGAGAEPQEGEEE